MDDEPSTSNETSNELHASEGNSKSMSYRGGRNCCVPHCGNNSRRNHLLSFHRIPKDGILKKKWIKILKAKGLSNPSQNHVVCSAHFSGGKKTYDNNIPSVFDTSKGQKERRLLIRNVETDKETNTSMAEPVNVEESETPSREITTTKTSSLIQELEETKERYIHLEAKYDNDMKEMKQCLIQELEETKERYIQLEAKYDNDMKEMKQCLFRLERFLSSDTDFRFYTGFPDYTTFKAFFNYLSPECCHLNYHGSATAQIVSDVQKKHGKARSLSPEEELFMVLSRLRCGFIGQDLAHRYAMSPAHISRIWTTWITFLHQRLRFLPIWPSREFVDNNMPISSKIHFLKQE